MKKEKGSVGPKQKKAKKRERKRGGGKTFKVNKGNT